MFSTFASFFFLLSLSLSHACNYIQTKATDGTVVVGRDMQFGISLNSTINTHPAKCGGKDQIYGYIGVTVFDLAVVDGMNTWGLQCSGLYLPNYANYSTSCAASSPRTITQLSFCDVILGRYRSVADVKKYLPSYCVAGEYVSEIGGVSPLHYAITDQTGASIVVEYAGSPSQLKIYDNYAGVMTNSPTFDWHLTNLNQYISLTPSNPKPVQWTPTVNLGPAGNWGSMVGLPADASGASRFVRLAVMLHYAQAPGYVPNAAKAVTLIQHMLNFGEAINGTVDPTASASGFEADASRWEVMYDLKNLVFYYRSYNSWVWTQVNVGSLNLNEGAKPKWTYIVSGVPPPDVTSRLT